MRSVILLLLFFVTAATAAKPKPDVTIKIPKERAQGCLKVLFFAKPTKHDAAAAVCKQYKGTLLGNGLCGNSLKVLSTGDTLLQQKLGSALWLASSDAAICHGGPLDLLPSLFYSTYPVPTTEQLCLAVTTSQKGFGGGSLDSRILANSCNAKIPYACEVDPCLVAGKPAGCSLCN